ncbi:MAG TPA: DUF4260 domain-containing protein [Flavobacteriales bacterium]|nr:DUF4260 domain-containing protein [Flavobacteriales bacterium]HMR27854.1 DUF4260 domain-containing protein [Flavobacteriales bacterium]
MKNLLRLEELAQFLLCLGLLIASDVAWWVYLLLLLGPDIGMLGYLVGPRVGAISYNVLHHKAVAVLMLVFAVPGMVEVLTLWRVEMGVLRATPPLLAGFILYGHASMDRIFGYGLKFGDNFHHTHLGWIGRRSGE